MRIDLRSNSVIDALRSLYQRIEYYPPL